MMLRSLFTFIFLLFGIWAMAQSVIYGTVTDDKGEPIYSADVFIDGTEYLYYTDENGYYELEVEPGSYVVTVSVLGFKEKQGSVDLQTNERVEWNVALELENPEDQSQKLDEIVVTADSRKSGNENVLLAEQKKASVIIESIGAGEISRKGISDAGEAVKSIVGITKEEGSSNVYVRGLGDRYQNTTFNGLPIPSNDVEKKNINLDVFDSSLIESVKVSKAHAAEISGDFSAGNVDVIPKTHFGKREISVAASAGVNTSALQADEFKRNEGPNYFGFYPRYGSNPYNIVVQHGVDPINAGTPINLGGNITIGNTIKMKGDSKFSYFLGGGFSNEYRFEEGLLGSFNQSMDTYFPSMERYVYNTTTSALAHFNYQPNRDNSFSYVSLFVNSASDEVGYYGINGNGYDPDLADNYGFYRMNNQFDQTRLLVNQLLGKNQLMDRLELNWSVGYNYMMADQPDRKRITLLNYQRPELGPLRFSFNNHFDSQRFFQNIDDEEVASKFIFKYTLGKDEENPDILNFGYAGRLKFRDFQSIRYGLTNFNVSEIDPNNLNAIFNLENFLMNFENNGTAPYNTVVLNPAYPAGEVFMPGWRNDLNLPGRPEAVYDASLISHAVFASYEFRAGEKWLVIPGIRFENFAQYVNWNVVNVSPGSNEYSSWEFLPSLNIKYAPNSDLNLRLAGSKTVSIPEFKEIAPFVYEDVAQSIGGNPDLINPEGITQGNTGKKLSDIYNFDAKVEWFPKRGELLSLAAFAKIINAPINLVVANDAANVRRYFRTGNEAKVYGVEFEFEKNLLDLSVGNLSLGGNVAYTYTEQDLFSEIASESGFSTQFDRDSDQLQGASPFIANADLSFNKNIGTYKTTFTVAGNYFSDRIFALGSTGRGNQIEKGVPTLNFIWNNQIGENLELNISVRNLLNPQIELVQEKVEDTENLGNSTGQIPLTTRPIEQYKKGVGLGLSVKYNF